MSVPAFPTLAAAAPGLPLPKRREGYDAYRFYRFVQALEGIASLDHFLFSMRFWFVRRSSAPEILFEFLDPTQAVAVICAGKLLFGWYVFVGSRGGASSGEPGTRVARVLRDCQATLQASNSQHAPGTLAHKAIRGLGSRSNMSAAFTPGLTPGDRGSANYRLQDTGMPVGPCAITRRGELPQGC